jgi:hypothetical protein
VTAAGAAAVVMEMAAAVTARVGAAEPEAGAAEAATAVVARAVEDGGEGEVEGKAPVMVVATNGVDGVMGVAGVAEASEARAAVADTGVMARVVAATVTAAEARAVAAGAGVEVEKGVMVDTRGPIRNPTDEFLLSSRPSLHSTPKNGSRRQLASG